MSRQRVDYSRSDIRWALKHGWTLDGYTGRGHIRVVLTHNRGRISAGLAATPGDHRTPANNISRMRRLMRRLEHAE